MTQTIGPVNLDRPWPGEVVPVETRTYWADSEASERPSGYVPQPPPFSWRRKAQRSKGRFEGKHYSTEELRKEVGIYRRQVDPNRHHIRQVLKGHNAEYLAGLREELKARSQAQAKHE